MNKQTKRNLGYAKRDKILREIGYSSYKEYLASPLWASIREYTLREKGASCSICKREKGLHVHHRKYHKRNLLGKGTRDLFVLCAGCHRNVEFTDGEKCSLAQAKRKFNDSMRERRAKDEEMKTIRRILREGYANGSLLPDRIPFRF